METAQKIVTEKNRQEMNNQGFTVFEKLFKPEEMEGLAKILEDMERKLNEELKAQGDFGINRANEITFNSKLAEQNEEVLAFNRRPEFVEIGTAFVGPDVDLYWNQTVFKHPEVDKIFPWHQDDAYTEVDPYPYLTLWLAITDATEENGCISVMPESFKRGLIPHEQTSLGWEGHSNDDPNQGVMVPVPAGSLIAFWSTTLHKSGANRSQAIRKAYVIQHCKAGTKYAASGEVIEGNPAIARNGQSIV